MTKKGGWPTEEQLRKARAQAGVPNEADFERAMGSGRYCYACKGTGFKWIAMTPGAAGTMVPCNRYKSCREARGVAGVPAAKPAALCIVTAKNLGWCAAHSQELYHCVIALEAELAEAMGPLRAAAKYDKEERVRLRARAEKAEARVRELEPLARSLELRVREYEALEAHCCETERI